MTDKLLTETDYNKILEVRLKHTAFKFLHAEIKPISENSEGFMGEHYKLKITYQRPDKSEGEEYFFLKTKPASNALEEQLNLFQREIFVYDFLLKDFAKLGYDTSFAAKCYLCKDGKTLVMQDITLDQFKVPERKELYSLEQIKALLTSVALYHGAGFAYERFKTKELGRPFILGEEYMDVLKEPFFVKHLGIESFSTNWFNNSFKAMDKLVDLLPINEIEKKNFQQMLKDADFAKIFATKTNLPKTCGHGDLWTNNMMFKQTKTGGTQCCLLDFQIGRYFYPAYDVSLAIFFHTTDEFRRVHLTELYQYYYDTLTQILRNYGHSIVDIMTLDQYHESLKLVKYEVLIQCISAKIVIFVPAEKLTEFIKGETDAMLEMYNQMDVLALQSYKTDESFKKTITDTLFEIYNELSSRR